MIAELVEAQTRLLSKKSTMDHFMENKNPQIDDQALERGKYPLRHRLQVGHMKQGPGLEIAEKYLSKAIAKDALIILAGDRGPGKTQIATWWAAQRTFHGKSAGRYTTALDLISDIKTTWHQVGPNSVTEHDLVERYKRTPYLVLDEFHERGASDWETRTLINLIDYRYYEMKCTVIICNCKADMITQAINASIIDRANETGGLIYCDWPSYRK